MKKVTKEYVLTKPSYSDSSGNLCLETITVRVKAAPYDIVAEACAKTFERTCFNVIMESITKMGSNILGSLNRISLLHEDLDVEERLRVVNSLNSNISMINERILDVLLPEADPVDEHGGEVNLVAEKVRQLILKNQQTAKEVTELIQSITQK